MSEETVDPLYQEGNPELLELWELFMDTTWSDTRGKFFAIEFDLDYEALGRIRDHYRREGMREGYNKAEINTLSYGGGGACFLCSQKLDDLANERAAGFEEGKRKAIKEAATFFDKEKTEIPYQTEEGEPIDPDVLNLAHVLYHMGSCPRWEGLQQERQAWWIEKAKEFLKEENEDA